MNIKTFALVFGLCLSYGAQATVLVSDGFPYDTGDQTAYSKKAIQTQNPSQSVGFGGAWADGYSAGSYVQDGLVVQYDGIENAGVGTHREDVTMWTNLAGEGRNGTLGGSCAWLANGLQVNSVSGKGRVTFDATHTAAFTFDICLKVDKTISQYARIIGENERLFVHDCGYSFAA